MEKIYKSLRELGVPTFHPPILHWRRSYLSEVKSGELIGKEFKTKKGKKFICEKITKDNIYFHNIEMNRKYAYFYLPTVKQLTVSEKINKLKELYPNSRLYVPRTGCQLHGDIDATLTLEDGIVYTIPWNY